MQSDGDPKPMREMSQAESAGHEMRRIRAQVAQETENERGQRAQSIPLGGPVYSGRLEGSGGGVNKQSQDMTAGAEVAATFVQQLEKQIAHMTHEMDRLSNRLQAAHQIAHIISRNRDLDRLLLLMREHRF